MVFCQYIRASLIRFQAVVGLNFLLVLLVSPSLVFSADDTHPLLKLSRDPVVQKCIQKILAVQAGLQDPSIEIIPFSETPVRTSRNIPFVDRYIGSGKIVAHRMVRSGRVRFFSMDLADFIQPEVGKFFPAKLLSGRFDHIPLDINQPAVRIRDSQSGNSFVLYSVEALRALPSEVMGRAVDLQYALHHFHSQVAEIPLDEIPKETKEAFLHASDMDRSVLLLDTVTFHPSELDSLNASVMRHIQRTKSAILIRVGVNKMKEYLLVPATREVVVRPVLMKPASSQRLEAIATRSLLLRDVSPKMKAPSLHVVVKPSAPSPPSPVIRTFSGVETHPTSTANLGATTAESVPFTRVPRDFKEEAFVMVGEATTHLTDLYLEGAKREDSERLLWKLSAIANDLTSDEQKLVKARVLAGPDFAFQETLLHFATSLKTEDAGVREASRQFIRTYKMEFELGMAMELSGTGPTFTTSGTKADTSPSALPWIQIEGAVGVLPKTKFDDSVNNLDRARQIAVKKSIRLHPDLLEDVADLPAPQIERIVQKIALVAQIPNFRSLNSFDFADLGSERVAFLRAERYRVYFLEIRPGHYSVLGASSQNNADRLDGVLLRRALDSRERPVAPVSTP